MAASQAGVRQPRNFERLNVEELQAGQGRVPWGKKSVEGKVSVVASVQRGRPRDPEVDRIILETTLGQLATVGYARMSVDSIASEAGVGKPTVYRRWRNKADLSTAAVEFLLESSHPRPTGVLRSDLIAQLEDFRTALETHGGMAFIGNLLVEESRHPGWLEMFRERTAQPRRRALHDILQKGVDDGLLSEDLDLMMASRMLVGAYYAQYLDGGTFLKSWATDVVDACLVALTTSSNGVERVSSRS